MSNALVFKISADMTEFRTGLQNAQKSLNQVGKKMRNVGKTMSTYVTAPILAMGAASVVAFDKQAKAIAQVDAAIKSTGGAAGYTSQQLQSMASALQDTSLYGDEEILKGVTAQLLTFTNIAGEQFGRTQQAALDLATRLDGDLKGASIQLGKALNDPVANLSALSRSGIQFSEDQKKVIKGLVETNRLADAQTIILNELENQYGGSAKAAAEAGLGPMKQLSNSIGDLTEDFGEIISKALIPVVEKVKMVTKWFRGLDDSTKKIIVVVGALAAAIGPVLMILGTMIPALTAIAVAIAAINAPILIVIATVASLVAAGLYLYDNWEAVTDFLSNSWVTIKNAFLTGVIGVIKTLTSLHVAIGNALGIDLFQNSIDFITDKLEGMKSPVNKTATEFKSFGETVSSLKEEMIPDMQAVETEVVSSMDEMDKSAQKTGNSIGALQKRISEFTPIPAIATKSINDVAGAMTNASAVSNEVMPQMSQNASDYANANVRTGEAAVEWGQAISSSMQNAAANVAVSFGEMIASAAMGGQGFQNFGKMILGAIASFMQDFGKALITMATGMIAVQTLAANPFAALAAGIALVAGGVILQSVISKGPEVEDVPAFANGGLVFGPTMGLIGEGSGTTPSNPEVIAPLDKLKQFIGGGDQVNGTVTLEGKISGRDIYLSSKLGAEATSNLIG